MSFLYCPKCGNRYQSFKDCLECGVPLQAPNVQEQQEQNIVGDHNQSVQVGRDVHGDIHIQQQAHPQKPLTLIERAMIKPIRMGSIAFKNKWLLITGVIGVLANLVKIIDFWAKLELGLAGPSNAMLYIGIGSMILIMLSMLLYRTHYLTLPFGYTIERDRSGRLYFTKITGTCGQCQHPVRVKTVGPKEHRQTLVICTYNQDHVVRFDQSVLGDVGEDYYQQQ